MHSIRLRLMRDLKKDPRKTTALVFLAVLLVIAWYAVLRGKKSPKKAVPVTVNAAVSPPAGPPGPPFRERDEKAGPSSTALFPAFLSEALPFEAVGKDPFRSPLRSTSDDAARTPRGPGSTAEEMERRIVDGFEVACTVLGKGEAYAMVDGRIVKAGDRYKKFLVKEIGEGFVLFAGERGIWRREVKFQRPPSRVRRPEVDK